MSEPVRITSAPISPADEMAGRMRRYIIAMSIRTVCFILAVVFRESWLMWLFLVGAVFLPYVAVVLANAADRRDEAPLADAVRPRRMLNP
jgi:ABC-type multidrug transport system fused ATPase/permease subunit